MTYICYLKEFDPHAEPIGADISVIHEPDILENGPKTAMEEALSEQLKNTNIPQSDDTLKKRGCYYTKIPRLIKKKGALSQDLTSLNLDKVHIAAKLFKIKTKYPLSAMF